MTNSALEQGDSALFERYSSALPPGDIEHIYAAADELTAVLADAGEMPTVMVAYGGGKDSSFALAFMRGVQWHLRSSKGVDFQLRVATFRHAGMPRAVMENVDRAYTALGMHDDPRCEMLVLDGETVRPFSVGLELPDAVVERGRRDILMTGHRCAGDGRPTFCNACNLNMVRTFGAAAAWGDGVDVIVTGDSTPEQRDYYRWTTRLAASLKLGKPSEPRAPFRRLLDMFDGIGEAYSADVHGSKRDAFAAEDLNRVKNGLAFFSIYNHTAYESGAHWEFLSDYLGFVFDEIAFSFSESDCGNPGLMAHMRGLKAERVSGRPYAEGIGEYVGFATRLMAKKDFPEHLVERMRHRYETEEGVRAMRTLMEDYLVEAHRISEQELECMLFAPFVDRAKGLDGYVEHAAPELASDVVSVRTYLEDPSAALPAAVGALSRLSGLTPTQMRHLFNSDSIGSAPADSLLRAVLRDDPHKEVISTHGKPGGQQRLELISGR